MSASTARLVAACGLALAILLGAAGPAQASFHVIKIREVSGATNAAADTAYVELQMFSPFQNLVMGHEIDIYDEDASAIASTCVIPSSVTEDDNQRTVLIAETGFAGPNDGTCTQLGDLHGGQLGGAGAVCFRDGFPPDCVSWGGGSFTGAALLPDNATPFGTALPSGTALKRDISAGCATLLESSDDTNDTAADFDDVARDPDPNSTVPEEMACAPPLAGGGATTTPVTPPPTKKKKCKRKKKRSAGAAKKKCRKRRK